MIQSKRDLKYYIEQDALARGISQKSLFDKFKLSLSPVETWVFQKRLRKLEYYLNCKKDFVSKIYIKDHSIRLDITMITTIMKNIISTLAVFSMSLFCSKQPF